ncbi:transmembrane protein 82 [Bombina bombina]|uniref:transmembrane protein 82 n=1 Tax=Bombina bombina TaxID=8345 RepID=UPI00235A87BA|nr:transmembrane protein 82 [Bombina bombina]
MGLLSYVTSFIPDVPWHFWGSVDSLLQGLVGACAVSVLSNFMRVHLYIMCLNDPDRQKQGAQLRSHSWIPDMLHLLILTLLYSLLGPRVGALVVLEFSLRAISMILSLNKGSQNSQLFLLCQFSIGCGVSCSLDYLHEGAPHRTWNLLLAAGLSGLIVWQMRRMGRHVGMMYELHSRERYCGVCLSLLACWRDIPAGLWRALKVAFLVSDLAAIAVINRDFLSTSEAVRFWTPLTICYTLLVIYMQEEQHQNPTAQMAYQTVFVRMGGLLILMMTVGRWADIVHIFICLLGEIWCLAYAGDMLNICREQDFAERPSMPRRGSPISRAHSYTPHKDVTS